MFVVRVAKNFPAYCKIHSLITVFTKFHIFKFNYLETVLYVRLLNFIIPIRFKHKCMCYTELSSFKSINIIQTPKETLMLTRTMSDGDYSFQDRPVTWLNSFRDVCLLHVQYFRKYCSVEQLSIRAPLSTLCLLLLSENHFVIPVFPGERLPMLIRWTGVLLWDIEWK
jgi:hypothetical protein